MHELQFNPRLLRAMQAICRPLFYHLFNIRRSAECLRGLKAPYIILGNHSDWWDPFFLMLDVDEPTHFVATEDLFSLFPYGLFIGRLGAIPKVKFLPDLDTVKTLFKCRDLGRSVGIFPEGERNWDGRTLSLLPATLKLIKKLREPVVAVTLKGAHLSFPRWAYFIRRGKIELDYRVVATKEELESMGAEELIARIESSFRYDEHEWNREQRIAYRGPGRSLGIEALLYLCPRCGKADGIRGRLGGRVACSCGFRLKLDEYGEFAAPKSRRGAAADGGAVAFRDPGEWHRWEKERLAAVLDAALEGKKGSGELSPDLEGRADAEPGALLMERGVLLFRRRRGGGRVRLQRCMRCDLYLFADRMVFRGRGRREEFALTAIDGMNVLYRNLFDFAVGGQLYRLRPRNGSRSLLKLLHAARHLAQRSGSTALGSES